MVQAGDKTKPHGTELIQNESSGWKVQFVLIRWRQAKVAQHSRGLMDRTDILPGLIMGRDLRVPQLTERDELRMSVKGQRVRLRAAT